MTSCVSLSASPAETYFRDFDAQLFFNLRLAKLGDTQALFPISMLQLSEQTTDRFISPR